MKYVIANVQNKLSNLHIISSLVAKKTFIAMGQVRVSLFLGDLILLQADELLIFQCFFFGSLLSGKIRYGALFKLMVTQVFFLHPPDIVLNPAGSFRRVVSESLAPLEALDAADTARLFL